MTTRRNALNRKSAVGDHCGNNVDLTGRKATAGVDPEIKASNLRRLRRIEGQIRGLQRMVEEDRYCSDILTQLSSVQEALKAIARALMRNHLTHCADHAIRTGSVDERESMYDELLGMIYKNAR